MDLDWWSTDRVVAAATVATTLILLAAAIVAWVQVREARKLRREQARPFVVVDLEPVAGIIMELVVGNVGATMARDVRFSFEPELETTLDEKGEPLRESFILKSGLESFPPGRTYRMLMDRGPDRKESHLPDRYEVEITYEGLDGRSYTDRQIIDYSIWWGKEEIRMHTIDDVWTELKAIGGSLRGIQRVLDDLVLTEKEGHLSSSREVRSQTQTEP